MCCSVMFLRPLGFPGVPVDRLCQHSGVCISAGNSHHCQCPLGYTGSYCEDQLDECSSNPCQHGATCRDFIGGYRCEVSERSRQSQRPSRRWPASYKHGHIEFSCMCLVFTVYRFLFFLPVMITLFSSHCFFQSPVH